MKNIKRTIEKLKMFGFSEIQAQIYLNLIEDGESRIQAIAERNHIPRTSVYDNLKVLHNFGVIEEIIDQKIKIIKAYPIRVLSHNLTEKQNQLDDLQKELIHLEKEINELVHEIPQQVKIRYYKGVSGVRQLFWNTLK